MAVAGQMAAEREQRSVMAVVQRLERGGVTPADERGEALVIQAREPCAGPHGATVPFGGTRSGTSVRPGARLGTARCIAGPPWRCFGVST
jgi:hypothetical protein